MRRVIGVVGVLALFLGGLWLAQGLGLVRIKPIACVANCEALTGPSPAWAAAGLALVMLGGWLAAYGFGRRQR